MTSIDVTSGLTPLGDLRPHFTVTVLWCQVDDVANAFATLVRFLRGELEKRGRALSARMIGETLVTDTVPDIDGLGSLADLGFDGLYAAVRKRTHSPSWLDGESGIVNVTNELTLALCRHRLVALCAPAAHHEGQQQDVHRPETAGRHRSDR